MQFKKINLIVLTALMGINLLLGNFVLANGHDSAALGGLNVTAGQANITPINKDDPTAGLTTFLGATINSLFVAVGVVFLTVILIGGYLWMVAQGNEDKIGKAKKFIFNGLFGMMAIFLSYALVYVILFALNNATTLP